MESAKVSVTFFLDASRPNSEGKCLIKLNVYCRPDKQRYPTVFHVSKEDWNKIRGPKLKDENLREIRDKLNALKKRAEKIIEGLNPFSFVAFEDAYLRNKATIKTTSLKVWFENYIAKLEAEERIGSAMCYTTAFNSLNEFRKNLHLQDITASFLNSYEIYMRENKKSPSTTGSYLRQLRAIIKLAIKKKVLSADNYPFEEYQIPATRNVKKALPNHELKKLLEYHPDDPEEYEALDYWILMYLLSGINPADVVRLLPSNIDGHYLNFYRFKTRYTKKKDLRPIKIGIPKRAIEIIERRRNTDPQNPYLFPILHAGMTAKQAKFKCQDFAKWINDMMEKVRSDLKINQKVRNNEARHTYATVMKRKKVDIVFIKETLGHSSLTTTELYLDSFPDETKVEYASMLENV
ncbi:MAG: hypothetical protein E6Q24_15205 [Chitinophagaceae bacterium]|nr:MAG: hypothetical protein E6Q24_15205 [Chitinophagaceae bacterium]